MKKDSPARNHVKLTIAKTTLKNLGTRVRTGIQAGSLFRKGNP
jgi:hypothetical protein